MRRILRKIAEDDFSNLGDTSTLADPAVVDDLVNNRQKQEGTACPLMASSAGSFVGGDSETSHSSRLYGRTSSR